MRFASILLAAVSVLPATAQTTDESAKLTAPAGAAFDRFGHALALSGDALAVGADREPATYLFRRAGSGWSLEAELPGTGAFGISVALEGERLLVGDDLADDPTMQLVGAAHVFVGAAGTWTEEAVLRPPDGGIHDHFGAAVALDGDLAVVGAPEHIHGGLSWGTTYVFRRDASGWALEQELAARGASVAVDGATLASGNPDLTGGPGEVHVFVRTPGGWVEEALLTAAGATDDDRFGTAVALRDDTLVVGASGARPLGLESGAVYVFERAAGVWTQTAELVPAEAKEGDAFGISVAFDGASIVAGATGRDEGASATGAAWRYTRDASGWCVATKLLASDASASSFLGRSVAVEGETVAAGADFADGLVADAGAAYVYELTLGAPYCFGDGSATACPCGNAGGPGEGCASSTGDGALLAAAGSASVVADDLELHGAQLVPGQPALLFVGLQRIANGDGAPFGDGLRCAGGEVRRLGTRVASATGTARWGPGLAAAGGWLPGDIRSFQVRYRDPLGGPCGSGFNLSHGLELELAR